MFHDSAPHMIIGAFRQVAAISKDMTVEEALITVAQHIEDGLTLHAAGKTKHLTGTDLIQGKFIGDLK